MVKAAPGEVELLQLEPGLAAYVMALKARSSGRAALVLKRLLGMVRDYPREALLKAVDEALVYGMFDLTRLDVMVLRNVRQHQSRLPGLAGFPGQSAAGGRPRRVGDPPGCPGPCGTISGAQPPTQLRRRRAQARR